MIWVALLACSQRTPGGPPADDTSGTPAGYGLPSEWTLPLAPTPPDVDVVVVGSGPAGLAAATTIQELGLSVVVLDRDDHAGQGVITGARCFAAGTSYQAAAGIVDSAETALAEWDTFAGSGGSTPGIIDFVTHSAETLDWLVARGMEVQDALQVDTDAGTVKRIHAFVQDPTVEPAFVTQYAGELILNARVDGPVLREGRVEGVTWVDLLTGEAHTRGAHAVVMATGGFARDLELVESLAPSLKGRSVLVEANYHSDGGGISFLDAVGAGWSERERIGIYVHGVGDPGLGSVESLIGGGLTYTLMVDATGARFGNELEANGFDLYARAPASDLWAVFTSEESSHVTFTRPVYNVDSDYSGIPMDIEALIAAGGEAFSASSAEALAEAAGIDADGLRRTLGAWTTAVDSAAVDAFGRDARYGPTYTGDSWYAVRIRPAVGKVFGGVDTAVTGEVLGPDGAAIPGLYAAGEVAGMVLGGGAHGLFSGSVCACYYGGRVAGASAAAAALARRQ